MITYSPPLDALTGARYQWRRGSAMAVFVVLHQLLAPLRSLGDWDSGTYKKEINQTNHTINRHNRPS
jgi:hypothetical protein